MKTIFFMLVLLCSLFLTSGQATNAQEKASGSNVTSQPQDVGNKICPVSGDKINEKMKATYEYEGKIYNLCCPMCIDEFKKDPAKYITKTEEEEQNK